MIELKEKANNYAEENAMCFLKEAFAKVYADGYHDGYKDCEEEIPANLSTSQTEFVDLGLPSGTLWANDYERDENNVVFVPFGDAEKYSIPNAEQWDELANKCKWEYDKAGSFKEAYAIGPNGKILKFSLSGLIHVNNIVEGGKVFFWISDEKDGEEKNAVSIYDVHKNGINYSEKSLVNIYSGYKLPIRLVRKK